MIRRFSIALGLVVALVAAAVPARAELGPENLLLLCNKNIPESVTLANFYAKARLVPVSQICALPLPPGEDISFAVYERDVVPAVRDFIRKNNLEKQITCIVTFYGVPLRVGVRQPTPADVEELALVRDQLKRTTGDLAVLVEGLEVEIRKADRGFRPQEGMSVDILLGRADLALRTLGERANRATEATEKKALFEKLLDATRRLGGPAAVLRTFGVNAQPGGPGAEGMAQLKAQLERAAGEVEAAQQKRYDASARSQLRTIVAQAFGLAESAKILDAQVDYLQGPDPKANAPARNAAFDSELAMLWWGYYPRAGWVTSPLWFRSPPRQGPPVMMTMRLDAPQAGQVQDMILASLRAERDGLKGTLAVDSGAFAEKKTQTQYGGYGWCNERLGALVKLASTHTKLKVVHEDSPAVFPPASPVPNVALYCGWYSVRQYVPSFKFVPGAVAYHIASFEMSSLHNPGETGWCRGLLNDGVAATLGPVDEPFLAAFPPADEFFPLLMTGKLTLAEVYWKTSPWASWMICAIGDPLYRPYAAHPALGVQDLPEALRKVVEAAKPTTRASATSAPTTRP